MPHPWAIRLGRIPSLPDIRNFEHLMDDKLAAVTDDIVALWAKPRIWTPGPILDQGDTSECVDFTGQDEMNGEPHKHPDLTPPAGTFYAECQAIDGWPLPHDGTSVHALATVMHRSGFIPGYQWTLSEWVMRRWVLEHGPVMLGTNWRLSMFTPDAKGIIHVNASDSNNPVEGGHAYRAIGYDYNGFGKGVKQLYKCQNHWGTNWGEGGFFYLTAGDMAHLIAEGGEVLDTTNWDGVTPVTP